MTTIENRYLSGNFAPVEHEVSATDLTVVGRIPAELEGRYLRNGPNPISYDPASYHWFTGTGMVHGLRLRGGRAEWYRNRFVRTPEVTEQLGEPAIANPHPIAADHAVFAANTNAIGHAGQTLAIVEAGGAPIELTYDLDTIGATDFGGTLPYAFSAHPKWDPRTKDLHVMTYWWGWGNQVQYVRVNADGFVDKTVDIATPGQSMIHDTAITDTYVIVMDLPCVFNLEAAMSGASLPYHWDPDYQARIGLLPRADGAGAADIVWCEIDPAYIFHPMNAYDLPDGRVVLDVARHPKMFASDLRGPNEGLPTFDRYTLDPSSGKGTEERLDDRGQEFPRINERLMGLANRYGYAVEFGRGDEAVQPGGVIKHDLVAGTTVVRNDGPEFGWGEVVFVNAEGASAEDDGYVMGLRYDGGRNTSDFVILHAQDIAGDPVAVVELPQRVPNGFHGNWVKDSVTPPPVAG